MHFSPPHGHVDTLDDQLVVQLVGEVELVGDVLVDESDETHLLFRVVSYQLDNAASSHVIGDLFDGGVWMEIAQVDQTVAFVAHVGAGSVRSRR